MASEYELRLIIKAIDQASATLKTVKSGAEGMGDGFATAAEEAKPLGLALAAVGAAGTALIGTATMTAARVEVLGTVLNTVGGNAGYTESQLASFEEGVRNLGITTGAARQGLIRLSQAEIDLSYATDLARMAQDAAVIANINSSEAYERLVTVVQRGSPVMARTLGLNVDFAGSYKRMADQLGKSTLELTANEKMQARLNEVLAQGAGIAGAYEAAMGDVGKRLTSLPRLYEEAGVALGEAYLPLLGNLITVQEDLLKGFIALEPAQQASIARFLGIGTAIAAVSGGLILVVPKIAATITALQSLNAAALGAGVALGPIAAATAGFTALYLALDEVGKSAGVLKDIPADVDELQAASILLDGTIGSLDRTTQGAFDSIGEGIPVVHWLRREVEGVAGLYESAYVPAVRDALNATEGFTEGVGESARGLDQQALAAKRVEDALRAQENALTTLQLAIEGPIREANEEFTGSLDAVERKLRDAERALAALDPAHEDYDQAVRDSQGELHNLRMAAAELEADHKKAINGIIYDMILAQLALDGWEAGEIEFALETGRAMGLVDEATYNTSKAIIGAFEDARAQGLLPTVDAMLGIRDAALEIPGAASAAGEGIASGMQPGIDALGAGIHTADQLDAAIHGIERTIHISVYWDHYGDRPDGGDWGGGGPQPGIGGPGYPDKPAAPPAERPEEGGGPAEYQHGTDFVPETGWAMLHRGEAVVPADQNKGRAPVTINQFFGRDSIRDEQDLMDAANATRAAQQLRGAAPVL